MAAVTVGYGKLKNNEIVSVLEHKERSELRTQLGIISERFQPESFDYIVIFIAEG